MEVSLRIGRSGARQIYIRIVEVAGSHIARGDMFALTLHASDLRDSRRLSGALGSLRADMFDVERYDAVLTAAYSIESPFFSRRHNAGRLPKAPDASTAPITSPHSYASSEMTCSKSTNARLRSCDMVRTSSRGYAG